MISRNPSEKPIAVALLGSRGMPARYGGFETLVETLVLGLPKDRFKITVFCERALKKNRPNIPRVNLVYFPVFEKLRMITETLYDIVALAWAASACVEVIILFGYTASLFCLLPRLFGKPVIVNVNGLEWKRSKFPRPIRSLLRLAELVATRTATLIVCDSRAIQSYYQRRYHVSSRYIPNPARFPENFNAGLLRRIGLEPRAYYLVVARLEPENHIDTIIEGFIKSGTRRKLAIVGTLTNTRYVALLQRIRTPQVVFLGGIYDRPLLDTLRAENIAYIHGHEVGGTNPSLLESMACGSLVVAFDVPFNREVASDSASYFKTPSELAGIIRDIEKDPMRERIKGARARNIAQKLYSPTAVVRSYGELLEAVYEHAFVNKAQLR